MNDPLVSALERTAARSDPAPLLVSGSRPEASAATVLGLARAIAGSLPDDPPGSLFGLAATNGPGFVAGLIALRLRGLAVLLLDGQAPEHDLRRTSEALGASGVLACAHPWPTAASGWIVRRTGIREPRVVDPAIAVLKLTSGSTGIPRGVLVSGEALLADDAALASTMGLRVEDRILCAIPMSHSYGFASIVLPALVRGSVVVVPETNGPLAPLDAARESAATVFPAVPAYLQALVRMSRPPRWPASLRLVLSAGAVLPPETARRFRELYGLPVHVFYGSSETGGICYDRDGAAAERGTVGTPVDGARITLEPLPGETAEGEGVVSVSSPALGAGYVPEPDERLRDGRFLTSDIARWRDGELQLLRRMDGLIHVKGKKIDPLEIEAVVRRLPGVDEVVALGIPGQGSQTVVRVVIACAPGRVSYEAVVDWCRGRLADHKLPRSVVVLPEIPRTSRGKVDRAALAAADLQAVGVDG